jgi:hypothetical protein
VQMISMRMLLLPVGGEDGYPGRHCRAASSRQEQFSLSRCGSGRRGKGVGVPFRDPPSSAMLELRGWCLGTWVFVAWVHR